MTTYERLLAAVERGRARHLMEQMVPQPGEEFSDIDKRQSVASLRMIRERDDQMSQFKPDGSRKDWIYSADNDLYWELR